MIQNASKCFGMFQNTSKCSKLLQNASNCFKMLQNASTSLGANMPLLPPLILMWILVLMTMLMLMLMLILMLQRCWSKCFKLPQSASMLQNTAAIAVALVLRLSFLLFSESSRELYCYPRLQGKRDAHSRGKAYSCLTIITIIILMVCPFGWTTRMHCLGAQLIH